MPREGYVDITISQEAHEYLQMLKQELSVRSYSEAIIRSARAVLMLKRILALTYDKRQIILPRKTELLLGL